MRRLADLQERDTRREEPRRGSSSEPEYAVEPQHDVERRLKSLHKRLSKTSPALARELEFPVDDSAGAASPLRSRMNFVTAVTTVDVALNAVSMAVDKLNDATRVLIQAANGTPHQRGAYVFANLADNLGGNLGELDELLGPMRDARVARKP